MNEGKLYKTRLCVLYRNGRCARQNCSFAHGDAELRGSFNGRRLHQDNDLRDTIKRRRSPERRYSPERSARDRRSHYGHSPSRSLELMRSNEKRQKTQPLDDLSDLPRSPKISYDNKLKQVQSDINKLDRRKCQLELDLEERAQEVDSLNSKLVDLEAQLYKEKDDCKRLTSMIKKFLRAHNRHLKIQDELKRSQSQLQKLGDQIGSEITRPGIVEKDLNINIGSDVETTGNHLNPLEKGIGSSKKRSRTHLNAVKEAAPLESIMSKKLSRWNVDLVKINTEMVAGVSNNSNNGTMPNEARHRGVNNATTRSLSGDKLKILESGLVLPSTSMAAHAFDEVVDTSEEDKINLLGNASNGVEKGDVYEFNGMSLPLPPPPPLPIAYSQFKGDGKNLDVEGHEMEDVDVV